MKTLTVLELSKLYNINRQTIYNNIKKGILSKNSENKIDLAEAIRVFGEPVKKQDVKESVKVDSPNSAEVLLLRQQIDMLKNQLDDAKDRESFYQNQIDRLSRLTQQDFQELKRRIQEKGLRLVVADLPTTYQMIQTSDSITHSILISSTIC
jgi:predicted DNA-binding protein YlxM (UPF0122 family)